MGNGLGGFDPDCDARHIGKVAKQEKQMHSLRTIIKINKPVADPTRNNIAVQENIKTKHVVSPFTSIPSEPIDEIGKYPYLVIRLMPAVYQRHQITVYRGEALAKISHDKNFVQHPEPITDEGVITPGCRKLILDAVFEAVTRTKFRMAVVWGEEEASYVEPDGSINESTEPPSGGVPLPNKIAFDQREIIDISKQ